MQPPLEQSDIRRRLRPLVRRPILKEETLSDGGCDRGNSAREGQLDLGSNDKPHKKRVNTEQRTIGQPLDKTTLTKDR